MVVLHYVLLKDNGEPSSIVGSLQMNQKTIKQATLKIIAVLIAVMVLGGCVIESKKPLTEIGSEKLDNSIIGTWYWNQPNETGYIHIGLDSEKRFKIVMVEINGSGDIKTRDFLAHSSALKTGKYLNVVSQGNNSSKAFLFIRYEVSKEGLNLFLPDSSVFEKAVESKMLKAEFIKGKNKGLVLLDSSKNLADFVVENDALLFPEGNLLRRIKLD